MAEYLDDEDAADAELRERLRHGTPVLTVVWSEKRGLWAIVPWTKRDGDRHPWAESVLVASRTKRGLLDAFAVLREVES